jgi:hypothetical protein
MGWISHQNPSITAFAPFPHLNPRKLLIRRRLLDQTSGFWGNFWKYLPAELKAWPRLAGI